MKKRNFLYLPAAILFVFAAAVLAIHFSRLPARLSDNMTGVVVPFTYSAKVVALHPEAKDIPLKVGDVFLAINGRDFNSNSVYLEEISRSRQTGELNLKISRKNDSGQDEIRDVTVPLIRLERNFSFYARLTVGLVFNFVLPTFCVLIGFWVVFVRVYDPLAWMLLFIMLGCSAIGIDGHGGNPLVAAFMQIFFSTWAMSMLLFGIYFPERLKLDVRFPWLKWIFIVPFAFQILSVVLSLLTNHTGINFSAILQPFGGIFSVIMVPVNALGIFLFFVLLGWKSGTLQNPDARRRLKFIVYGASLAMLPAFSIILYSIIARKGGSFFDIAPWWYAMLSLFLMMVFPLMMAYVIIVHRAMDVSVVVRQGLQYALAQNGVKALQFILLAVVILGTIWIIRSYGENTGAQIAFVVGGLALIPLIDYAAKNLRVWIDKKFFREAYNAEQILSELSEDVRTMVETKPLLETVSAKISESLHVPQVILLLKKGSSFQAAHSLGYENPPAAALEETDKTIEKLKRNETLVIYQDDENSWIHEEVQAEEREKLQSLNSQLLLPVGSKNNLSGVISLSPKRSEEPYSPNDLRLLKSVAAQTGLALENSRLTEAIASEAAQKERLNRELEIAREVQERLFPQELPVIKGLDYCGACRPALGVGGDYYDFLELPEAKFGIAIGDVSGKGIGASLMMASLQASLRGQAIHCGSELAELMKHVNTLVYEASTSNRYATFFYAQLDTKTLKMIYVNAGHNPPVVIRKNGEILRLEDGGAVVGMLPSMFIDYAQGEIQLEAGDLFVGSTDGITEAMNPREEEWSEEAMIEELKNVYDESSDEIIKHIVAAADRFADGAKQHDDMTMIVVKVKDAA